MTLEELQNTAFHAGMTCIYRGKTCEVIQPDFSFGAIKLNTPWKGVDQWVPCEDVTDLK